MKTLTVDIPDRLHEQLESFARDGWCKDRQEAVIESIRRFLESHQPGLMESHIMQDVKWGLHGSD